MEGLSELATDEARENLLSGRKFVEIHLRSVVVNRKGQAAGFSGWVDVLQIEFLQLVFARDIPVQPALRCAALALQLRAKDCFYAIIRNGKSQSAGLSTHISIG